MVFAGPCTSSPTAIELLGSLMTRLHLRNSAKISTGQRSPSIATLPQELVDMIISYFVWDTQTLLSCSMVCCSWYIAATPHLHYSLTTYTDATYPQDKKRQWPKPLKESFECGLLPFVRRLRIRQRPGFKFSSERLDSSTLRYLSAITNLQELQIQDLQVPSFMPDIQQRFGHFAPSLRCLSLLEPEGTCRQLLYFIGLFPNLQNLNLLRPRLTNEEEDATDSTPVPLSKPPLCGWLTFVAYEGKALIKGMIELFGGLRFRHMYLHEVKWTKLLLEGCAETLETLRLHPTDSYGKGNAVRPHFDLSKNTSLRTLETDVRSISAKGDTASDFLKTVLSTITSPLPLDVVIIHGEFGVGYPIRNETRGPVFVDDLSAELRVNFVRRHAERFKVFREMHKVRKFRLVLRAEVLEWAKKHAVETLERTLEEEAKDGGLDYLGCPPLIVSQVSGASWAGVHLKPVRESHIR